MQKSDSSQQPVWNVREIATNYVQYDSSIIKPIQAHLLWHREITDRNLVQAFVQSDMKWIRNPSCLPDIERAASLIDTAIIHNKHIAIVGDCDTDGITATAIMVCALRRVGVEDITTIIRARAEEGRGLIPAVVDELKEKKIQLVITVDNGSSSVQEIQMLRESGIDVIITDHHHLPDQTLQASAFVNPQRTDCTDADLKNLSGAGVALFLARLLIGASNWDEPELQGLILLAGLGTLADIVPIGTINHILITRSMNLMEQQSGPGVRALLSLANVSSRQRPTARDLSFGVVPRINAAGRMGDPLIALELLLTEDPQVAQELAEQLDHWNIARQERTEEMLIVARQQAEEQMAANEPIIFLHHESWPVGIIGLVAGRIASMYDRLAIAVAGTPTTPCRGSLRGPDGFNITNALSLLNPPLTEFGGHAQAGGFTTTYDQLPRIREHLRLMYNQRKDTASTRDSDLPQNIDALIPLARITRDFVAAVQALEPYGQGFESPVFLTTDVRIEWVRPLGSSFTVKIGFAQGSDRRSGYWHRSRSNNTQLISGMLVDILWQVPGQRVITTNPEIQVIMIVPR
jgi:single-stranded-DNA-specific exonuclease